MSRSRRLRDHRRTRRQGVRAMFAPRLTQPLHAVWEHACWALQNVLTLFTTPADLALREYIPHHEHRRLTDLIRHLELLARRLILAAALALNLILRPKDTKTRAPRRRRRILLWPDRPYGWRANFTMMPARKAEDAISYVRPPANPTPSRTVPSFPLARRLEAVRRVLAKPDIYVRRFAIRLTRIAQQNDIANRPRHFALRAWRPLDERRLPTLGCRFVATGMETVQPLAESALERWNQAADPG